MTHPPRIAPLAPEAWTPEVEAIFPILVPPGAQVKGSDFNSLLVIAHHPQLAEPFVRFNSAVSRGTILSSALRELAVLRVAWRTNCLYEWVHHLIAGAAAGLGPVHFKAVLQDSISGNLTAAEQAVLRVTDEIFRQATLSDTVWAEISSHLSQKQILELIFAIGCFQTVSAVLNTAQVEIEPNFLAIATSNGWPLLPGIDAGASNI